MKRRDFLQTAAAVSSISCLSDYQFAGADEPATAKPWLRKTLKLGMINVPGSLTDKFAAAKEAGFEGVETNAPAIDVDAANQAAKATGLIIDGTVGGYHWAIRHTDPDPSVRAKAMENLKAGIAKTAAMGADTMLLVPGHGKDGTDAEVYDRAKAAIDEAVPVARKYGVAILVENVWNDFCYDHEGGSDQTADRLAKFLDEFDPKWVGVQYDIGNHWKYGDPADWIRTLGPRIKKLDIKGFSRESDKFTNITEGDIDWPSVEQALHDIQFTGWLAAEVGGGDLNRLKEVSANMDKALHCGQSVVITG